MKKRKLTAVFVALSLLFVLTSFPAQAASQSNASVRIVDGLAFAGTVSNEEIADITPEERIVLEQEVSGTIISTRTIPYGSKPGELLPSLHNRAIASSSSAPVTTRITISRESNYSTAYGSRPSFKFVMTATWSEDRDNDNNFTDFIGMHWMDDFILINNTQSAYTAYNNASGSIRFDYNCSTQDEVSGSCVSFAIDIEASDYMIVLTATVYTPDNTITDIWAAGAYTHCGIDYSITEVAFNLSVPPGFTFAAGPNAVNTTYTAYDNATYNP